MHIGKSSAGWKFCFRAHDDLGLTSWQAWREFLTDRPIRDEYEQDWTLADFTARVTERGESPWCRVTPSVECNLYGFGGRWRPEAVAGAHPDEYHDPEGFDFSRTAFS